MPNNLNFELSKVIVGEGRGWFANCAQIVEFLLLLSKGRELL